MKKIPLTQGKYALVDDEDYEFLNQWKWHAKKGNATFYACRDRYIKGKRRKPIRLRMHRVIMGAKKGQQVDHREGDGLDNQRHNLRLCNCTENGRNSRISKNNKSGYKGVLWNLQKNKWQSHITVNYKTIHIGFYFCLIKAARAYDEKAKELFGEFAKPNFK